MADAPVVEDRRRAGGANKHADAGPDDQGFGVVDGDAVAADQFDDVRPERRATLERANRGLEAITGHNRILPSRNSRRTKIPRAPHPPILLICSFP